MDRQHEHFENYLREFEPRRPRPLPATPNAPKIRHVAAGVAVVILCVGGLWLASRKPGTATQSGAGSPAQNPPVQEISMSTRELTRLALENPSEFQEALTAASKRILPRFDGSDSTLRVLTKE